MKNAPVVLTILGLVTYLVLRLSYATFYRRFQLQPEDVGLNYGQTLAQAAPGVIASFLFGAVFGSVFWAIHLYRHRRQKKQPAPEGSPPWWFWLVVLPLVATVGNFANQPARLADQVKKCQAVHPETNLLHLVLFNPSGLRGNPVRLRWIAPVKSRPAEIRPNGVYMNLGQSNGTLVLYDGSQTLRIPNGAVVVLSVRSDRVRRADNRCELRT